MTDDEVRAAYDQLAAGYDADGDTKPSNAYLERPAMRSLLPTVEGTTVLDAGCGAGHLTAELVADGAHVVGFDSSAEMLRFARERAPGAAFVRGDLGAPLSFDTDAFGGVASSLAFHYVPGWEPLFAELARVVRPGGWLTFTVQHPHADFVEYDGAENYHETERVTATWTSFGKPTEVPAYRRPLESMITPALDAGFRLDRLLEPTPTEEYREADPERYKYEATNPNFLALRFDTQMGD